MHIVAEGILTFIALLVLLDHESLDVFIEYFYPLPILMKLIFVSILSIVINFRLIAFTFIHSFSIILPFLIFLIVILIVVS